MGYRPAGSSGWLLSAGDCQLVDRPESIDDGQWSIATEWSWAHAMDTARTFIGRTVSRMGDFRELIVWQRAQALAVRIDRETRGMRRGHAELADQLRRSALSVPTNLAEGASKGRDSEFTRFVGIAIGSAAEMDSLLSHALAVQALDDRVHAELSSETTVVRKMLFRRRSSLGQPRVRESVSTTIDHRPQSIDD